MNRSITALLLILVTIPALNPDDDLSHEGLNLPVPDGWSIVDLAANPQACVRFDRPTVYLGHPGDQSTCPANLSGRTAGIVIEPLDDISLSRIGPQTKETTQVIVREANLLITAEHTEQTRDAVHRMLAAATPKGTRVTTPTMRLASASRATAAAAAAVSPQPGTYLGRGFDTCAAPSQATMNAWRNSSPYRAIGIYISGASRSCAQPNLTATWVTNQTTNGWRLIPIELGYQAPCGSRQPKMSSDPATARSQGTTAANSAVSAARNLGIPAGSAIYNDIEHYPSNASCKAAVLSFLSGWTVRLHALGYLSGMYSSGSSGITDVCSAYNDSRYTRLDHLWIAWWNGAANTDAGLYCPSTHYANHQRLHQYAGDVTETWGGVQMRIDRDYLDVAAGTTVPPDPTDPPPFTATVDNTTTGRFTASANWGTSTFSAQRFGTDYRYADPVAASDAAWYQVNIPETASYEVAVWYPANSGYNDSTPYVIVTTTGNQSVRVNQRLNGGQWVSLGVFTLAAGDGDKVGVSRWTSGTGYVIADAIRITRV